MEEGKRLLYHQFPCLKIGGERMKQFFNGESKRLLYHYSPYLKMGRERVKQFFSGGEEAIQQQMKILDMVWRMVFDIGCLVKI